ncbi:MAG: MoaD/ThiS family protein [Pirellulales bacterium]
MSGESMTVRLELFALARQRAGRGSLEMALPRGATVGHLRSNLAARVPELAGMLPHCMFAIDTQYAGDEAVIPAGALVACIPPVSGG